MSMENRIFCARSYAEVNTEYSCFFVPKAKGQRVLHQEVFGCYFVNYSEPTSNPSTFCLQLNHATDVILPLFPSTIWTVASHLQKHGETL